MELNKKYIIGTHVMFYEIEMISEFVDSIINSCKLTILWNYIIILRMIL